MSLGMEKWFFSKWVFLVFLKKGAFFWEGGFFQNLEVFFKIFKKVWFKSRLKRIKSNLMGAFERAHRERSETHLHGVSLNFFGRKKTLAGRPLEMSKLKDRLVKKPFFPKEIGPQAKIFPL